MRKSSLSATRSRSSGWAATIRTTSSAEKSSRSTSLSRGERIGATGLPCSLNSGLCPLEERPQDGAHFLACPRRSVAPALVDELAQALRPLGRFEVGELEVGVVDRELGEDRFVVAQRLDGRAVLVPEPADELRDLETDRRRPVELVLHGPSHDPGRLAQRQPRVPAFRAPGPVA